MNLRPTGRESQDNFLGRVKQNRIAHSVGVGALGGILLNLDGLAALGYADDGVGFSVTVVNYRRSLSNRGFPFLRFADPAFLDVFGVAVIGVVVTGAVVIGAEVASDVIGPEAVSVAIGATVVGVVVIGVEEIGIDVGVGVTGSCA